MEVCAAVVQPSTLRGEREVENLSRALSYIETASRGGAQLVVFPEGYPGPYHGPVSYSPLEPLCEQAKRFGIHVVASWVEAAPDVGEGVYRLALKLIGPEGQLIGTYYRTQPNTPDVAEALMPGKFIAPGDELGVFETAIGKIGLIICGEIWWPEMSRVLALQGADIIVAPIGGVLYEIRKAWRTIVWARAMENMCYVLVTQNLFGREEGLAVIAAPEEILAESDQEGIVLARLDLGRLQWLRNTEEGLTVPKPYRSIPGLFKDRRPELYGEITKPNRDQRDYYYFLEAISKGAPNRSA
ncbi:MAG: carbon-nitrogen hydrolase family protein [Nitrospinota bacterium]